MLDSDFKKQRAQTARELAAIPTDRFTKRRLLDLAARYEDDDSPERSPLTPIDLKFERPGTGSER